MLLNIGLAVNDGTVVHPTRALAAVRAIGGVEPRRWAIHQSDSEPTLVVECPTMTGAAAYAVSEYLRQDAIALSDGRDGWLVGPAADAWGEFNPDYFLTLDGRRLSAAAAARAA